MRKTQPLLVAALLPLAACGSKGDAEAVVRPTLIEVDPSLIAGDLCSDAPGAVRRYVATVADTTPFLWQVPPEDLCPRVSSDGSDGPPACPPFALPSSPPLPCTRPVAFGNVTPGHRYIGRLDGYDRTDLTPLAEGSRVMLGPDGEPVAPVWAWICDQDVVSAQNWSIPVQGCHPIVEPESPLGETVLNVQLAPICDSTAEGITVTSLVVTDPDSSAPGIELGCDDVASFRAVPDQTYTFQVTVNELTEMGVAVVETTTCYGVARQGQLAPASCDLLPEPEPEPVATP